jgi:hypothetical protein
MPRVQRLRLRHFFQKRKKKNKRIRQHQRENEIVLEITQKKGAA